MNIQEFRTNPDLETEGAWCDFDDASFLIAANMNTRHKRALQKLAKKNPGTFRKNDQDAQEALVIEAMAETILLGWKNVKDGEQEIPYSVENAKKLLSVRVIRDFVSEQAGNLENYKSAAEAVAADNVKSGGPVATPVGEQ